MDGLRNVLAQENPLQIVGTINAYTALLAKKAGFRAIYLSGAGVANASFGMPDLGITNLDDVAEDVCRITYACDLPLLVDIDTGWGSAFNIARAIKTLIKAGAAGIHMEDQVQTKRCGHRPKKEIVAADEMCDRIKAAVDAKHDPRFVLMARTDALAIEGMEKALERIHRYVEAGAEMIFFEGATQLSQYQEVTQACKVPVLANITEFGVTPLFTKDELQKAGIQLILYPLSAFRAMSHAANRVYETIRTAGTQKSVLPEMQTREQLYDVLNYYQYEQKLDDLFAKGKMK
ncbi:Methylisocitrate lyase [Aquicella siphonis]|uniref:2-methylisocitrate lyase n=1 Tax=Aquicella siphonis TaxID=254247 RepID=A0A5E4PGC7_9COXI|nr:methylisocitrate lyase [Aquicella siphonis]VVC76080.1 Methylisocitrate lyase [Aquicella siphonis]